MAPKGLIAPPLAREPRYGLLAVSDPITSAGDERWQQGGLYLPEQCIEGGALAPRCGVGGDQMVPDTEPTELESEPIQLWGASDCSTLGGGARDWEARARRTLARVQSYQLALELWDGAIADAEGWSPHYLAGPGAWSDTVTNGAESVTAALGKIEQGLADCLHGGQGMVHMTPQLLVHAMALGAVRRDGTTWVTAMGHIVVADAGYSGSGPGGVPADAGGQWIYGTTFIQTRLSPIEILGVDASGVDRSLNDRTVYAVRLGMYTFDECCHVAAEVAVSAALTGGAS